MANPQVVIIMHNQLAALGVQQLLSSSFDISAHLCDNIDELMSFPAEGIDFVITDAQFYVEYLKHFLPRQSRTLIVAEHHADRENAQMIYANQPIDQLVATIAHHLGNDALKHTQQQLLSQREMEVLRLVASGMINKEIADSLNISINTVLTHRKNITSKLGIKSVSGLSFYAMMNGIIAPQ